MACAIHLDIWVNLAVRSFGQVYCGIGGAVVAPDLICDQAVDLRLQSENWVIVRKQRRPIRFQIRLLTIRIQQRSVQRTELVSSPGLRSYTSLPPRYV